MWWLLARLLISAGLLACFFVPLPAIPVLSRLLPHQLSLASLTDDFLHASPGWLLVAAALTAPVIVLVSWKWQILLRAAGVRESLARLVRMNLVGGFYSLVLPGEETGQLAKGVILARHSKGDAVAASIVVDEILGTLSVFSIALIALAVTQPFPVRLQIAAALAIMLAIFLAFLVLAVVPRFHGLAKFILDRLLPRRLANWLDPFWERLDDYQRCWSSLLAAFAITIVAHLLANVSVLATLNSVNARVSYVDVCWIYAAISALVTIPVTISGFGVRERANVFILGQLGVGQSTAFAVSLLAFGIGFIWSMPGAILQFGIRSKKAQAHPPAAPEAEPADEVAAGNAAS